ncbi:hypothetical protein [Agrococcus sp. TSP3-2-1]|uniref:hypothetical protein n=1 Tax=Agrococcus sp. TSP3-2-1 TaxID=2804583 RepID=UPI003CE9B826
MTADVPTPDGRELDAAGAPRVGSTGSVRGQPDDPAGGAQDRSIDAGPAEVGPAESAEPADRAESARLVIRKRGRRVSTAPVPGYTGEPEPEPQQHSSENDARLKGDVPPHWG